MQFATMGPGLQDPQVEVLHAMLGTMDPMWAPNFRDVYDEKTQAQVEKILKLLGYPYFLDRVITGEAWEVLAKEYNRFSPVIGNHDVGTVDGLQREQARLTDLHNRISGLMPTRDELDV